MLAPTIVKTAASEGAGKAASVRRVYRDLLHFLKHMSPAATGDDEATADSYDELRISFRRPLVASETIDSRLGAAQDRLAHLRLTTVMTARQKQGRHRTSVEGDDDERLFVYKDGKRFSATETAATNVYAGKSRVVSNWDGKNLDPESVKKHKQNLRRAGFANNQHAKGYF